MAIREILTDKDPVLHKKCHPVTQFDEKLWSLLDDMRDTLADANGAGLAAPQIGILRRVVVVIDGNDEMLEPYKETFTIYGQRMAEQAVATFGA